MVHSRWSPPVGGEGCDDEGWQLGDVNMPVSSTLRSNRGNDLANAYTAQQALFQGPGKDAEGNALSGLSRRQPCWRSRPRRHARGSRFPRHRLGTLIAARSGDQEPRPSLLEEADNCRIDRFVPNTARRFEAMAMYLRMCIRRRRARLYGPARYGEGRSGCAGADAQRGQSETQTHDLSRGGTRCPDRRDGDWGHPVPGVCRTARSRPAE